MKIIAFTLITVSMLAACGSGHRTDDKPVATATTALINPEIWPEQDPVMNRDAQAEERIVDLLARMTMEEKVGNPGNAGCTL